MAIKWQEKNQRKFFKKIIYCLKWMTKGIYKLISYLPKIKPHQ